MSEIAVWCGECEKAGRNSRVETLRVVGSEVTYLGAWWFKRPAEDSPEWQEFVRMVDFDSIETLDAIESAREFRLNLADLPEPRLPAFRCNRHKWIHVTSKDLLDAARRNAGNLTAYPLSS